MKTLVGAITIALLLLTSGCKSICLNTIRIAHEQNRQFRQNKGRITFTFKACKKQNRPTFWLDKKKHEQKESIMKKLLAVFVATVSLAANLLTIRQIVINDPQMYQDIREWLQNLLRKGTKLFYQIIRNHQSYSFDAYTLFFTTLTLLVLLQSLFTLFLPVL